MADDEPIDTFRVYMVDDDTDEETAIGRVEYTANGKLSVLEVDDEHDELLRQAVDTVNRKDSLVELTPPVGDAPRFNLGNRVIKRDQEEFLQALQNHLRNYYSLSLG